MTRTAYKTNYLLGRITAIDRTTREVLLAEGSIIDKNAPIHKLSIARYDGSIMKGVIDAFSQEQLIVVSIGNDTWINSIYKAERF